MGSGDRDNPVDFASEDLRSGEGAAYGIHPTSSCPTPMLYFPRENCAYQWRLSLVPSRLTAARLLSLADVKPMQKTQERP